MMTNNYLANFIDSSPKKNEDLINRATQTKMKQPKRLKTLLLTVLVSVFSFGWAFAQERTITGVVKDNTGFGLPGVSVYVKGTTKGTITDGEGKYSLAGVPEGATLTVQAVGYLSQDVVVGAGSTLDVELAEDITKLNEVVVVGYGTQLRQDLTGAIASVSSKEFNQGPITSPLQQLAGRAAGVNINQVGSEPGQAPIIRIRGISSLIGDNNPLVVVDGIQGDINFLNQIPPGEIETIDILKDASATAIYGSRGAGGVVLVTTKRGKAGKVMIEYSGVGSVESVAKKYDVMNASEWRAAATARGIQGADFGGNTDWFKEITRTGFTQTHNLAISGGSEKFTYRTSVTTILQNGIIKNSGSENYIARFQGTQTAFDDRLVMTFNLNTSVLNRDFNNGGRVGEAITRRPTDPIYATGEPAFKDIGNYFIDPNAFSYINPYARTVEIVDGDRTSNLFGSLRLDYEVIKGLTASVFGSWRKTDRAYQAYTSARTTQENARNLGTIPEGLTGAERINFLNNLPDGIARTESQLTDEKLFNFILNYKKTFGDHSLELLGVNEWQKRIFEEYVSQARGFLIDNRSNLNALQGGTASLYQAGDINSRKDDGTLASFLGRVNYSYKEKYLANASYRRDGSSRFGANYRWANFYSFSTAWRISKESFMSGVTFINDLKLRAGYGETGNQNNLAPLLSRRLVSLDGTTFFGGSLIPNFAITRNENRDLRWEVRRMFNAGIDFAVMNSKLSGTVDFFFGKTTDLLFEYIVPQPPFPFERIFANVGSVLNQGLEVTLRYALVDSKDLSVNLVGNMTTTKTEVTELSGSLNGVPLNTDYVVWGSGGTTGVASTNNAISHLIKGQALGTFYLFKHAGVDNSGTQIVDDLDGDGSVEDGNVRNDDRYIAGQALPKVTWAFTPSVRYKNFDLNMVIRGAHGHKIYNARNATLSNLGVLGQQNRLRSALDLGINNITYASDLWLEPGDFVRLENLTLGYNVNTKGWGAVKSLRVSFTANNLFVITKYTGIDPELSTGGGSGFGIDNGIYPRTRNFAIGINANFQ
jgi:TonB-dependent starch-binding outer membrane protein SusC